jgi:hypothetical protein
VVSVTSVALSLGKLCLAELGCFLVAHSRLFLMSFVQLGFRFREVVVRLLKLGEKRGKVVHFAETVSIHTYFICTY